MIYNYSNSEQMIDVKITLPAFGDFVDLTLAHSITKEKLYTLNIAGKYERCFLNHKIGTFPVPNFGGRNDILFY